MPSIITIDEQAKTVTVGSWSTYGALATALAGRGFALGIVTEIALAIEPAFTVAQHVDRNVPGGQLLENFDSVTGRAYSVSLFTNWSGDTVGQVWFRRRIGDGLAASYPAELAGGN